MRRKFVKRFSKTISLILLVVSMIFVLVGCKTATATTGEPVVVEPAPAPAAEPAPAPAAEPAPAPVVEEPAPEPAKAEALVLNISFAGYSASIEAYDGYAYISYPSFVTADELYAAAAAAYNAYGAYLKDVTVAVTAPGQATLTYPEGYTVADFDFAKGIISTALPAYISSLFAIPAEEVVVEEVVVAPAAPAPITKTIDILGYQATFAFTGDAVEITYPAFITNSEVADAAKAAYAAYSQYLQGTALTIDNGTAVLTFPVELSEGDFEFAVAMIEKELPGYAMAVYQAALAAAQAPAVEAVVAVEPAPAPAAEPAPAPAVEAPAPAPEAPAAAPASTPAASTTTTTKPATTTSTPAAAPAAAPAKKSSAGLIIAIIAIIAVCAAVVVILKKKKN